MTTSEIKKVIRQGGVTVNGIRVLDCTKKIVNGDLVKFGKRCYFKAVI